MSAETILALVAVFTAVSGFVITLLTYFNTARKDTVRALQDDNDKLKTEEKLRLDNDMLRRRMIRMETHIAILESALRQRGIKIPNSDIETEGAG